MTPEQFHQLAMRGKIPGMEQPEAEVAIDWTRAHYIEYPEIEYNFRLGPGVDPGVDYPRETRDLNVLLTQKRADILARRPGVATIVEIKLRVDFAAMGQLLGYRRLYSEQFGAGDQVKLVAAGRFVDAQTRSVLNDAGITVEIFPRQ